MQYTPTFEHNYEPVSYTHLDVYKRQSTYYTFRCRQPLIRYGTNILTYDDHFRAAQLIFTSKLLKLLDGYKIVAILIYILVVATKNVVYEDY